MFSLSHWQSGLILLTLSIIAFGIRSRARKIENSPDDASQPSHTNTLPLRTARAIVKPEKPDIEETPEIQEILHQLENTENNIFLTGKAGTGKSTILKYFLNITQKNYAVVAPTGIAAVNVNGQTIHSFFGFSPKISPAHVKALTNERLELVEALDCLIIDEISMVRADLLDCIEKCLHLSRKDDRPFGGVQIIAIGDPFQLPPVVEREDQIRFKSIYPNTHFFGAGSYQAGRFSCLELTKVHRQSEPDFIDILNAIRVGDVTSSTLELLHERTRDNEPLKESIKLVTTNKGASLINRKNLDELPGAPASYTGVIEGDYKETSAPTELTLLLKRGARVMLLNNQRERKWVNGELGEVIDLAPSKITVKFDDGSVAIIEQHQWEEIKFRYDKIAKVVVSEVVGRFSQFPLKLAWAITIHKSQGQSYNSVHIDLGDGAFAPGQAYVALSRCRSLAGISFARPMSRNDIITDSIVRDFMNGAAAGGKRSRASNS